MIDRAIEFLLSACVTLIVVCGAYLITWMAWKSIKENFKNCCRKRYKWICEHCGEVVKSATQPFCKPCCHIQRGNVKMLRLKK